MKKLVVVLGICFTATFMTTFAVAGMSGAGATAPASDAAGTPAFTQTVTVTRTNVASDGTTSVVATNNVTLDVDQTTNLQGRQEVAVSWSGAHPTGNIVTDPNSDEGQYEEYPMVLLECRGTGSTSVPAADQLSPETCWTQSWDERYQSSFTQYPPYQLDQYAATPGAPIVGAPSTLPAGDCQTTESGKEAPAVQYWVPWLAADGTVYDGGTGGLCGEPPESDNAGGSALPSNETFGVTGTDGTGSTDFDVFDATENATLGCSQTVACSLVAVPIMGISCDASVLPSPPTAAETSALQTCEETGASAPGGLASGQAPSATSDLTVSGSLWWSPSNWRNRITVPLTFAPPPDACSVVSSNNVIHVYGSELMSQATSQWEPNFCLSDTDKFSFVHVAGSEPVARNQVAVGAEEAAFTSYAQPEGYGKPVVNAPVAVTGFTISFSIDGTDGQPITTLKLTPLLLAKLLTNSYPDLTVAQGGNPQLAGNPLNITQDPQFIALNPGIPQLGAGFAAASELIAISEDSDVMEALTTYINDDPSARAWLNGQPDPDGMIVNPAYKGIQLPVDQWPLLSTWESTTFDNSEAESPCLQGTPEPFDSLLAAPLGMLEDISQAMQFDTANSTLTCSAPNAPQPPISLVADGAETPGHYFMIGITPLADDDRYGLQPAELQTTSGTFVTPSNASMEAATDLLTPDTTTGTWPIPYNDFETATGASAYPGTMVVYAAIPTTGLPSTDAADYASLLQFAATTGQTPGSGVGQLPPGYLPLTQANGLGGLADYTLAAAKDVAAQNGQVPPLVAVAGSSSPSTTLSSGSSPSTIPSSGSPFEPDQYSDQFGQYSSEPFSIISALGGSTSGSATAAAHHPSSHKGPGILSLGRTLNVALWTGDLWTGGVIIVLILGLALLGVLSVPIVYVEGRRRGRW